MKTPEQKLQWFAEYSNATLADLREKINFLKSEDDRATKRYLQGVQGELEFLRDRLLGEAE